MKIEEKEGAKILIDENGNFQNYLDYLKEEIDSLKNANLILDLSELKKLDVNNLLLILPFSESFEQRKKSFVVVTSAIEISELPETLNVVPTVGEAEDLIQMEEIERDLGF